MPLTWTQRKVRLDPLLNSQGDDDADALVMDRLLHGQSVIGKTSKTSEIDALRFTDKDLDVAGTLDYGQFGVIDVVTCHLDRRVYVRKSIEKRLALKAHDQCSPQFERDILLRATKTDSEWTPHLLCAFQTPTHLSLVMGYAEGGTLWDVLESSPHDGKVTESDLKWWAPQIVSAIHWCHSQGFAHRDIKPHNFVINSTAHILLIDFGSAAPLLSPREDGSQQIPKRHCLVPCGTCDYISPEILLAHEEALVALEMCDEDQDMHGSRGVNEEHDDPGGYGRETDWWSLGAMLYEMAYGVAPFFANDIRQTYLRIMDHETSLRFPRSIPISAAYEDLLCRLLTNHEKRLGRRDVQELTQHIFFQEIDWRDLQSQPVPSDLHLPQFTYTMPIASVDGVPPAQPQNSPSPNESYSQPFAFSALFQSSRDLSPGLSALHSTPSQKLTRSVMREQTMTSFIGFSWGPAKDAFPSLDSHHFSPPNIDTPKPLGLRSTQSTPYVKPRHSTDSYSHTTPIRPAPHTLPRTSTVRRRNTAQRRLVSDREAMKQLVDCVGMSARKKVLESGRKPRLLTLPLSRPRSGGLKKDVRFGPPLPRPVINAVDGDVGSLPEVMPEVVHYLAESEYTESEGPPSPSPSPRPGSAMSTLSRRSVTPTISASYSLRPNDTATGNSGTLLLNPLTAIYQRDRDLSESDVSDQQPFTLTTLDALAHKHVSIMGDIEDIEQRLDYLLTEVSG